MTPRQSEIADDEAPDSGSESERAPDVVDHVEDMIELDPLVSLFGDHARTRILMALLDAHPRPMNPSRIVEQANVSRQSWYRHKDDLLDTGLIREVDKAGNSPLYALVDADEDSRIVWLQKLRDWTAAYLRDQKRPDTSQ